MTVTVHRQFFSSIGDVLDDIKKNRTWPTTLVSGPSRGREVHWHAEEVHAYVMEGETDFLDAASSKRIPVGPGDKVVIPARALHAEGPVKDKVVYVIAVPAPLPYDEFLKARPEADLQR
jgi:hypothetical protein